MIKKLRTVLDSILDFIFPYRCVICGKETEIICSKCLKSIKPLNSQKIEPKKGIDKLLCYGAYSGSLKKVIISFKFYGKQKIAEILGRKISEMIKKHLEIQENTIIIPIPLHPLREKERGFNQAKLLSEEVSKNLNILCVTDSVSRIKETKYMHSLDKKERFKNIKNAFKITKPEMIKDKNIIVIDDIFTTGATMSQFALLLKSAGCKSVTSAAAALAVVNTE